MTDSELPKNLKYVCDADPGIRRKRIGRGFIYLDSDGMRITDAEIIARIKSLVIPPAWNSVWICPCHNGYLQATGRDEKKRKQYKYHPEWNEFSNQTKYTRLLDFADQLPTLRRRYEKDLKGQTWDKNKVLALATALLDELLLRVGNAYYTRTNNTYGLTTLRRKHIDFEGKDARLHFIGKKGSQRSLNLTDKKLSKLLRDCSALPGYEIFRYREGDTYKSIDSADLNEYLNIHLNGSMHVTAKDFRTWGGTVLCVACEKRAQEICDENPRKKKDTTLIKLVADQLGNTVAVCRKYYIHPKVLQYCSANTGFSPSKRAVKKYSEYEPEEQMVLEILNSKTVDGANI